MRVWISIMGGCRCCVWRDERIVYVYTWEGYERYNKRYICGRGVIWGAEEAAEATKECPYDKDTSS